MDISDSTPKAGTDNTPLRSPLPSAGDIDDRIDQLRQEFLSAPLEQRNLSASIELISQYLPRQCVLEPRAPVWCLRSRG
jgi:hypothetical protein